MQKNSITPFAEFMILLFLMLTIFIAHSIYLNMLFAIFISIVLIIGKNSVKDYANLIKNIIIWLLFIGIIYIIIYGINLSLILVLYKSILIISLLWLFFNNITFDDVNSVIYTILSPLKLLNIDIENLSFKATLNLVFIKKLLVFDNSIYEIQTLKNKYKYNIKNYLIPRLMYLTKDIKELEENLMLNFYSIKKEKMNIKSILILNLFFVFFVIAVFKEVIM